MSQLKSSNLKAGEFYGRISEKRFVASSIISEISHAQSVSLPRHTHELAYFSLLLDGSYSESYGRKSFSYRPLTVWWHQAGITHRDEIGNGGGRFLNVEIQSHGLELFSRFTKIPDDFFERKTALVWLSCRLYHEFKNWQLCSELVAEGITLEMLAHSARRRNTLENCPPAWLLRVVEKLNDEFYKRHTTSQLGAQVGVHPVYVATVFRQFYGETIGEYLRRVRLARASELLLDIEIPLVEIALRTGFSDQSHFTRVFKRFTGSTPGAFRAALKR